MEFIVTNEPAQADSEQLIDLLMSYNRQHIEVTQSVPLSIFVKEAGKMLAGIAGETFGNWLRVSYLCVDEQLRGQRIGSKLLRDAETEAKKRGCKYCVLDTFGFQAKEFYLKQGYSEIYVLENYPLTGTRHYLTKEL